MSNTLFLTRNGLLEPLGQSQVFAYLLGLARNHAITLVTFEKAEDWVDSARTAQIRAECDRHGIRWLPQKLGACPRLIASAVSLLRMTFLAWRLVLRGEAVLIHARSYIPAAAGWTVWRVTGTPFIFDMRALWPEELITAGRLRRGSMLHLLLRRLERLCLRDAAAIVSLTDAAVGHLRETYPDELAGQRIAVIPTCADLEKFTAKSEQPETRVYGCVGTVLSGWFRLDWLAAFFQAAAYRDPDARFEVVTRDDADKVRSALDPDARLTERLSISSSPSERVHEALQRQSASAMFYAGGEVSELGRSPTRMAEILGCGIPVIANDGVGDVAGIIQRYDVGVIVEAGTNAAMETALDQLSALQADPDLSARCRQAAEEVFSLERGTEAYRSLYAEILGVEDAAATGSGTSPESNAR